MANLSRGQSGNTWHCSGIHPWVPKDAHTLHLCFVFFLALLSLWPGPHAGVEEKSYEFLEA